MHERLADAKAHLHAKLRSIALGCMELELQSMPQRQKTPIPASCVKFAREDWQSETTKYLGVTLPLRSRQQKTNTDLYSTFLHDGKCASSLCDHSPRTRHCLTKRNKNRFSPEYSPFSWNLPPSQTPSWLRPKALCG